MPPQQLRGCELGERDACVSFMKGVPGSILEGPENQPWQHLPAAKEPSPQITEEAREQLLEASAATRKALSTFRREADPDDHYQAAEGTQATADKTKDELEMSAVVTVMQPILRFLQLLCENHNRDLQVGLEPRHNPGLSLATMFPPVHHRLLQAPYFLSPHPPLLNLIILMAFDFQP